MCKTQCLLAFVALSVGMAHSWDIAVGVEDQIIFYTDGNVTNTVNLNNRNITALAYDEVHNMMLYVDKQDYKGTLCSFNLYSEENKCCHFKYGIKSIAFDPATQKLFFTDTDDNSINWISLKSGINDNLNANFLFKVKDRIPTDIAVDSCRGYIYWTNTNNNNRYTESLERARIDGSGREIIPRRYESYGVLTLDIDPLTRKMYYFDGYASGGLYKHEYLNRADVNGRAEEIMYKYNYDQSGHYSAAKELTVSKDYLYWVYRNESYETVWQLSKDASNDREPEKISTIYSGKPVAIATNYKIEDRTRGLQDCESLSSLLPIVAVTNTSPNTEQTTEYTPQYTPQYTTKYTTEYTPQYTTEYTTGYTTKYTTQYTTEYSTENTTDSDLFCFHGVHVTHQYTPICICTPGYVGLRCEISVCHNYCLNGNCSLNDEELPTCRCNAGYLGDRCEEYACSGYCLNDGNCFLNEKDEPVCQCAGNHEGSRCEAVKDVTINNSSMYFPAGRNLTLADLLANWRKPSAKVTVTVEV